LKWGGTSLTSKVKPKSGKWNWWVAVRTKKKTETRRTTVIRGKKKPENRNCNANRSQLGERSGKASLLPSDISGGKGNLHQTRGGDDWCYER